MIKGKTKSGFDFEVNEKVFSDYRFAYLSRKCRSDDVITSNDAGIDLALLILGDKQLNALMEHCKDMDGYTSISDVSDEIIEIQGICAKESESAKK